MMLINVSQPRSLARICKRLVLGEETPPTHTYKYAHTLMPGTSEYVTYKMARRALQM